MVDALTGVVQAASTHADESEAARRLAPPVLAAMREAGLLRLCVPASLGGGEVDAADVLTVIERLAVADGAAGWCAMIASTSGCVSGHLPDEVAAEIYGPHDALVVGPFAPIGKAVRHESGYLVSGRWPFASMCQDSSWIMAGTVTDDSRRTLMFMPTAELTVHDTWRVFGLTGTGSHDIEARSVEVPPERMVPLTFDAPVNPAALYAFPVFSLLASGIAAVSLGIARGAIDDLIDLAARKTPIYAVRPLNARPSVQVGVASAEARLRAARSLLFDSVHEAWSRAKEKGHVDIDDRASVRLAAVHATVTAADVVTEMYRATGGGAIYLSSLAQRRLRDVHAATQHVMVGAHLLETVGRHLLGLRVDPEQI